MEEKDYEKISDLFEREVYRDAYNRFHLNYNKEHYNYKNFPFYSMEEARIILKYAYELHNNKFVDDATEYLDRYRYSHEKLDFVEGEEYWNNVSSDALLILEEEEYARIRKENQDNENIPVYSDNLGDAEILSVSISYVAYDDYPGQYRHIDIGRIYKKDLDKIKEYVIEKYVSYNLSSGGYNYSVSVIPYEEPIFLEFNC